jgi:transcriptional regulator with XRE-family HTH domain
MLPERLKTLRLEAKLTQKEIAKTTNFKKTYSYWEKERNPNIQQIADFFNVSTDYLLGNTDIKSKI